MRLDLVKGLLKAFGMTLIIFFVLGFAYPTVSAIISEHIAPDQSLGSPVKINGKVYGSYLLAEAFNSSIFFQPRPSAVWYNLTQSGGYEFAPDNASTINLTQEYLHQFMNENPGLNASQIPYSMVAASASGLDPNVPLAGAIVQVPRIAEAIHNLSVNASANGSSVLSVTYLKQFLNQSVNQDKRQNFPLFGSYYVNTVTLNFDIIEMLMNQNIISQSFLD